MADGLQLYIRAARTDPPNCPWCGHPFKLEDAHRSDVVTCENCLKLSNFDGCGPCGIENMMPVTDALDWDPVCRNCRAELGVCRKLMVLDEFVRQDMHTPWADSPRRFVTVRVWADSSYTVETCDQYEKYWGILSERRVWREFYQGAAPPEVR